MHPTSRRLIGQILSPPGGEPAPYVARRSTGMTIHQIIQPTGVYSGEERRSQGTLIAELIAPSQSGGPAAHEG